MTASVDAYRCKKSLLLKINIQALINVFKPTIGLKGLNDGLVRFSDTLATFTCTALFQYKDVDVKGKLLLRIRNCHVNSY